MKRVAVVSFVFLIVVSVLFIIHLYLNRQRTVVIAGENVAVQYRMGRVETLSWDRNRDGKPDLIAWVEVTKIGSGRHFSTIHVEEDRNSDGLFDHRFTPAPGDQFLAEVDSNQDGTFDLVLSGDLAREIYPLPLGPIY